jgi:prenyltransferase beta subunit
MPYRAALLLCLFPALAVAQSPNAAALKWVYAQQDAQTGGFRNSPKDKPSLRATSAAIRVIKYQHGELPHAEKVRAFVLKCYDPQAGAFAEPGGQPDVTIDSIGIMAAIELGIPKEKYAKAMEYLHTHAKTFEEVRIGAAAVEAWGVKKCPFKLASWLDVAKAVPLPVDKLKDGGAWTVGSVWAMRLRLGRPLGLRLVSPETDRVVELLRNGQRADGGWSQRGGNGSDLSSSYRVMRGLYLLGTIPGELTKLRNFIRSCHNSDGGFGEKPDAPSTMSAMYHATIITKWLDQLTRMAR